MKIVNDQIVDENVEKEEVLLEEAKEEKAENVEKAERKKKTGAKKTLTKDVEKEGVLDQREKDETEEVEKAEKKEETEKIAAESVDVIETQEEKEEAEKLIIEEAGETTNSQKKTHKKAILISTISVIAVLIVVILSTGFALLNINNTGIMAGIEIRGIDIQGLNKEQAIQKLTEILDKELEKEIHLQIGDFEYSILPTQIEAGYNIEEIVDKAYAIGRKKNIFANNFEIAKTMIIGEEISLEFIYNEKLLDEIIEDIIAKMPDAVIEPDYYREEDNRLIITKGHGGNTIDKEKTKELILDKIKDNDNKSIVLATIYAEPKIIDLDKIYSEVYTEPKDAYYIEEPFQVFPHIEGVDFDLEAAKEMLKEEKDEYEIGLIITLPEVTTNKIGTKAFPDLLSRRSTRYDMSLRARSSNLQLAAQKIDGTVVMPGEVFSYNQTVGKRTINEGYQDAIGYVGGRAVPTLGGGICQVSSTLYDSVVYANLEIVERRNHMFMTSYMGAGRDATVAWGAVDFKFRNTRKYPIMISATAENGIVNIDIFGVREEVEYDIEIAVTILSNTSFRVIYETNNSLRPGEERVVQGGMNGCRSITYKITKLNGVEISREVLSTDTYDPMNKIIQRGPTAAPEPVPEPTPDPVPDPTPAPDPGTP